VPFIGRRECEKKIIIVYLSLIFSLPLFQGCSHKSSGPNTSLCTQSSNVFSGTASLQSWSATKAAQVPVNELPGEFDAPYPQTLANLAWEDGVYITRDGLTLYSTYIPMDALQATLSGATPVSFYKYERGDLIDQDFSNPILGQTYAWLHEDVAMSQRSSVNDPFCNWTLSNLKGKYYNLGALVGIQDSADKNLFDYFAYTDDSGGQGIKIKMMKNVGRSLASSASGTLLPSNVDEPGIDQDNPHIELYDRTNPQNLVLFYDSDNKPGGAGGHDIWYSTSSDGGTTWTNPLKTINTSADEIQPHLYFDGNIWWLYYAATNPSDGKLAIYRAQQGQAGNWNNWQNKQLVVSAGTAAGVGEPTLTGSGDLSFVVVTHNTTGGTAFDQYDSDPWFMKKK
jgi:hypothetical protein